MSILVEACVETARRSRDRRARRRGTFGVVREHVGRWHDAESTSCFESVRERVRIPIAAMVRPRGGSFVYTRDELEQIWRDLDLMKSLGADVLVFGILNDDGSVDRDRTREFVVRAGSTPVTMHLAFDKVPDLLATLDFLMEAGVARVLTSGAAGEAAKGVETLASLVERGGDRISIMAGGKVRAHNARRHRARQRRARGPRSQRGR